MTANSGQGGRDHDDQGSELKECITDTHFSTVTESHMARPLLSRVRKLTSHTAIQFSGRERLYSFTRKAEKRVMLSTLLTQAFLTIRFVFLVSALLNFVSGDLGSWVMALHQESRRLRENCFHACIPVSRLLLDFPRGQLGYRAINVSDLSEWW